MSEKLTLNRVFTAMSILVIAGTAFGFIFGLRADVSAHGKAITELQTDDKSRQKGDEERWLEVKTKLARIEALLEKRERP